MRIILHGGQCCGIKHIYSLWYDPTSMLPRKKATKPLKNEGSCYMNSPRHFFHPEAPRESYKDRLDRYLAFLDEHRPKGICEIVLSGAQLIAWEKTLLERGFLCVNKCKNSNSGCTVYVYHRNKE